MRGGKGMLLINVQELLHATALCGEDYLQNYDVKSVYASDMMSDVLAQVKGHPLLLTGLCNPQVIRTAEMVDISCVVFVRGKSPDEHILELAKDGLLCVLRTDLTMFEACGILYQAGLCGGDEIE